VKNVKREYPDAPLVGVAALILRQNNLLLAEKKNEPGKGLWSPPAEWLGLMRQLRKRSTERLKRRPGYASK